VPSPCPATIAVLDPPRELTLRWRGGPAMPKMTTSFWLAPVAGGTRLTGYETGYNNLPGSAGAAHAAHSPVPLCDLDAWIAALNARWDARLQRLKAVVKISDS
jgi:hypothetical protein